MVGNIPGLKKTLLGRVGINKTTDSSRSTTAKSSTTSDEISVGRNDLSHGLSLSVNNNTLMFGGQKVSLDTAIMLLFLARAQTVSDLSQQRVVAMQNDLKEMNQAKKMLDLMQNLKTTARKDGNARMPPELLQWLKQNKISWSTEHQSIVINTQTQTMRKIVSAYRYLIRRGTRLSSS